jgi:hypothetical protein
MKALLATVALGATLAFASAAGAQPPRGPVAHHDTVRHGPMKHHRHKVCTVRRHHRVCHWR